MNKEMEADIMKDDRVVVKLNKVVKDDEYYYSVMNGKFSHDFYYKSPNKET